MTLEEMLAAEKAKAATLRKKALDTPADFTEKDGEDTTEVMKSIADLESRITRTKEAAKALEGAGLGVEKANTSSDDNNDGDPDVPAFKGGTVGERFVNSAGYKAFQKAHPTGVEGDTPISIKAEKIGGGIVRQKLLTNPGVGNPRSERQAGIDDMVFRPPRRLLDLVTRGRTNTPWFEFRQIVSKTNNASIVPEATGTTGTTLADGYKPVSGLTTALAEAKAYTYADGMEVTNQELADDGIMSSIIDSTLTENLEIEVENILLNGTGTGEPKGILATSGVLQQAFATDVPTTIRKAVTKLYTTSGATIRGVLMNPADDEAWDLLKGTDGHYLFGGGPYVQGPKTAWGFERITSQSVAVGQAIIGDFSTIHLLQLEALSILAFNQHADFARRNLTYVRAEERLVQFIRNAARLCVVDLTAGV